MRPCSIILIVLLWLTVGSGGHKEALNIERIESKEESTEATESAPSNDGTHSHDHHHAAINHHHHRPVEHHPLSRPLFSTSKVVAVVHPQRRRLLMKPATGAVGTPFQRCGTENLPPVQVKIIQERIKALESKFRRGTTVSGWAAALAFDDTVTIDVSFHILYDGVSNVGNISNGMVDDQIRVLNAAYAPHGFQFRLRELVRTDYANWYYSCNEDVSFKAALHNPLDGPNVLYLYTCQPTNDVLGYATWPVDYVDEPMLDGVVLLDQSLPGGMAEPYHLGDTAVHEVGHWLGLLHTFEGGCSPRTGGDFVKDTPAQAVQSAGCPVDSDTCPGQPGLDPIHNFMDYSDDACLTEFTAGQAIRMQTLWRIYRSTSSTGPTMTQSIALTNGVPLTGQALSTGSRQTYTLNNIPFLAQASVQLMGRNGDADLFIDLCSSITTNSSNESCKSVQPITDGSARIEVFASTGFTNMTITARIEQPKWVNLTLGSSVNGLRLGKGESMYFIVRNVGREMIVQVDTIGTSGDADMNVYSGNNFDSCSAAQVGSTESCTVTTFLPSNVYIVLTAAEAWNGLTIVTEAYPANFVTLSSGVPIHGLALSAGSLQYYVLTNVPAGSTIVIQTSSDTDAGDADLTVFIGDFITPDCVSIGLDSNEACQVAVEQVTTVFIVVQAYSTVSGMTVQATVSVPRTPYSILTFILSVFVRLVLAGSSDD